MSQWTSPYLPTSSWYYWSPWYSTQSSSTIPIIIHAISIFVQLLSDENVISFYKNSQNYNHPKYSGKFPHCARDWAQRSSKTSMQYSLRDGWRVSIASSTTFIIILFLFCCYHEQFQNRNQWRELEYVKFQLLYTFEPLYFFIFLILNLNVYISKIHTN